MSKAILFLFLLFGTKFCFAQDTLKTKHKVNDNLLRSKKKDSTKKAIPVLEGKQKLYDSQRRLVQDGEFKSGKLFNGKKYVYGDKGKVIRVEIWKNGEYFEDGQLE